jgi:hypothetical protein
MCVFCALKSFSPTKLNIYCPLYILALSNKKVVFSLLKNWIDCLSSIFKQLSIRYFLLMNFGTLFAEKIKKDGAARFRDNVST